MADHQDFLDLAIEMIAEEGREVYFGKLVDTAPDSDKPWNGSGDAPSLQPAFHVFAVFLPDGTLGEVGGGGFGTFINDVAFFKDAEGICLVAPPQGDGSDQFETSDVLIDDDSSRWAITAIKKLRPANLVLLYAIGVKR